LFYFTSKVTIKHIINIPGFFYLHTYIGVKYELHVHSFWWILKIHFIFIRQVASPSTVSIRCVVFL